MNIYQRYISKPLIFFSVFFMIGFLFIESNIGFKWIFNFTNHFFTGFKAEEISGNWRNFTLKNIKYDVSGISIQASSMHVILDMKSLFKKSTIFKEIDTKNLVIFLKKNTFSNTKIQNKLNILKKNDIFIKYPIIFQKIHVDKILFKTPKINIFFLNIVSSLKLIKNNIIVYPTCIDAIHVMSPNIHSKKKDVKNRLNFIKNINNSEKIHNFLYFFSSKKRIFIPLNIHLIFLKCKNIHLFNYQKNYLFKIELKSKVKNNILIIKKIKIDSSFLKMKSYGKIIFKNDRSILCIIKNKILVPRFHNKTIKLLFKANITNKFIFNIKTKNSYYINMHGKVLLDSFLDYPFYIKLQSKNLFWSIKKNFIFKLNSFHGVLKGRINNYFLSLKNIFSIQGMPSVFISLNGKGNLKNIFLKKIKIFPIRKKRIYKKINSIKNNIKYNKYILKLIGEIDLLGKSNNNIYNICIPKINLHGNFTKRNISILGSLYYKNFNFLEIPGISVFSGNNKLYLKGSLGEKYNIYSSVDAGNLNYFLPDVKGHIKAKAHFHGNGLFPIINSKILGSDLNWNNIYLKSIKIFTDIDINNEYLKKISVNIKNLRFSNFYINSLRIQSYLNNNKQNFYFLLKSNKAYINLILNGFFDYKTGNFHGFFKKVKIRTFLGKVFMKKSSLIYYSNSNSNIKKFYKKEMKIKDFFSSFLYKIKTSSFHIFHQSSINFKSKLSINTKLRFVLGKNISDGNISLTSKNLILERKIREKTLFEDVDYLRLSIDIIKKTLKSRWIVKKKTTPLGNKNIIGYLNIIDIYNKKNIEGQFTVSNFPISFISFFTTDFKHVKGTCKSNIKFFGTLYQPKILADIDLQNIFIKSDNLLKYMTLFFPYFLEKTEKIRINQDILMKKGNILFTLGSFSKNSNNKEWNLFFNSKRIEVTLFPKIKIKFSSQLNLHYLLSKYDIMGYIKFSFFRFKINEKNFLF